MEPWRDVELFVSTSSPSLTVTANRPAMTSRLVVPTLTVQISSAQISVIVDELL